MILSITPSLPSLCLCHSLPLSYSSRFSFLSSLFQFLLSPCLSHRHLSFSLSPCRRSLLLLFTFPVPCMAMVSHTVAAFSTTTTWDPRDSPLLQFLYKRKGSGTPGYHCSSPRECPPPCPCTRNRCMGLPWLKHDRASLPPVTLRHWTCISDIPPRQALVGL